MIRPSLMTFVSITFLASCGGKVVVDSASAGAGGSGAGGGPSAASEGPGPTSGSGSSCAGLQADLEAKIAAAKACSPFVNSIQCDGSANILDTCGCSVLANEVQPDRVTAATAAYDAWTGAGCGPFQCKTCPPNAPGFCQGNPDGSTGVCTPSFPHD